MTQTQTAGRPRNREIPPEETEALRATVPDDPIRLPEGHLACEACGVAVPADQPTIEVTPISRRPAQPVPFSRCPACEEVREQAQRYVDAHPALAGRLGPDVAHERVQSVVFGMKLLGQPVPDDLGLLLPRIHPAAHSIWFSSPLTAKAGKCSPYAFAHVGLTQRAGLRKAYADALRDRLSMKAPPVALPCPSGGCLFCGVASVERPAIEVARRGGVEAASRAVWREVDLTPAALGTNGSDLITGHLCPDCARAADDRGAVGWGARAQALVTYLAAVDPSKAQRVKSAVEGDDPPLLPAWRAFPGARPSRKPWAHLGL